MSQEKPKAYTAEFKESEVKLANDSDKPIAQAARGIGVDKNTLHIWFSKYSRAVDNRKAMRTDDHSYGALKRLKKEVAQLTEERNLLPRALGVKKASAYL